jgi:DNA repair protein RecN (Recombination protein N)
VEFSPGLNVLTGETGAGKTMVTVGLALVLGRRAQSGLVRKGAGKARVEARFGVESSTGGGVDEWAEDGELILARTLSEDGRSTARAGGQLSPLSTLSELGADLVEVHGQHQTQRLLSPTWHLRFLDRFSGPDHLETISRYRDVYAGLRDVRARLARLDDDSREREREKDLLGYQVREIEAARLHAGEIAELQGEESRLGHAERVRADLARARSALSDERGGADALREARAAVDEAASVDPGLGELAERMRSLAEEVADAAVAVRDRADSVELDPDRLEEVRARIAAIRGLERKYGEGEDGVLAFLSRAVSRLEELDRSVDEREELYAEASRLEEVARTGAANLGRARREAAPRLAEVLQRELEDLGMEGASVAVRVAGEAELGPSGLESAEILFSGGPDQDPMAIQRVASGGELSRTMLACRTVLADLDAVQTLVFDEVDSGIGGRTGVAVGRRLARLSRSRQVLVVTHLPQIACFADRHFRVTKEGGIAQVNPLEGSARVRELSRMLSGMPTEEAATHAEQLLAQAAAEKT